MFDDLIKAQKSIEPVTKDGNNPFYKNDYASLNASILACKQALNDNGFAVLQPIQSDELGVYVCTTLYHSSGEKIESKMKIVPARDNDPQAQGSAISYARRYALKSLLCMSDKDDDGETAMSREKQIKPEPKVDENFEGVSVPCKQCGADTIYKTGTTAEGKSWKGYFCSKDRSHKPYFVK